MPPPLTPVADPVALFLETWARVKATAPGLYDPAAMALATATPDGRPSSRIVLLRDVTPEGFQFFTNYGSRKARELDATLHAALTFYWFWLDLQVRVEGPVTRASAGESDAYFASRPRGSQVGAWASRQSTTLGSRADLERRCAEVDARFADGPVPRPPFWGGFTLRPARIEWWQAGDARLHDRLAYTRCDDGTWNCERLFP
jgi:pyridoxamine 5'-phosphate oxidase